MREMFEGICGFEWEMIEYYRRLRRNSFSIFFLFLIEIFKIKTYEEIFLGNFRVWIIIVAVLVGILLIAIFIVVCCICRKCKRRTIRR